ncbi:MAG TPA: hypothetical protein VE842_12070 [Pyrinomonadaceae bacterium]|nr:hypothetical protein [Pyrinomonadaceae bacterium]
MRIEMQTEATEHLLPRLLSVQPKNAWGDWTLLLFPRVVNGFQVPHAHERRQSSGREAPV